MTSGQKIATSTLISLVLTAAAIIAAYAGLFSRIEARFYQPSVIKEIELKLNETATAATAYHRANELKLQQYLANADVKKSFQPDHSSVSIQARADITGRLQEFMPGLQGIRFIDAEGKKIHFSTIPSDIKNRTDTSISFYDYDSQKEIDSAQLLRTKDQPILLTADRNSNQFIYSMPFIDGYDTYKGFAVFYVSAKGLADYLVESGLLMIGENVSVLYNADIQRTGTFTGLPLSGRDTLLDTILFRIDTLQNGFEPIQTASDGTWILFSTLDREYGIVGTTVNDRAFRLPPVLCRLLLCIAAVIIYLLIFLMFNLKQDEITLIRNRIRKLETALINDYLAKQEEVNWNKIVQELQLRKSEIADEIRHSLKKAAKNHRELLDTMFEATWDDILAAFTRKQPVQTVDMSSTTVELKKMMEEILSKVITVQTSAQVSSVAQQPKHAVKLSKSAATDNVDAVEELEELDELEELGDADTAGIVVPVEEVEEVEELDELGDADNAEPVEELEELDELGDVDNADATVSDEEAEEGEELDELGDADTAEPVEELEELDDLGDADNADIVVPVAEAKELEELGDADTAESMEEAKELDELGDVANSDIDTLEEIDLSEFGIQNDVISDNHGTTDTVAAGKTLKESANAEKGIDLSDFDVSNEIASKDDGGAEEIAQFAAAHRSAVSTHVYPKLQQSVISFTDLDETLHNEPDTEKIDAGAKEEPEENVENKDATAEAADATEIEEISPMYSLIMNNDGVWNLFDNSDTLHSELETVQDDTELASANGITRNEDGLFHIDNSVYGTNPPTADEEFRRLVDSIIN